jgi:DNA primase
MQQAISLILQYPQLVSNLSDLNLYQNLELPGATLLGTLLEIIQHNPQLTTGAILSYFSDATEHAQLAKLASRDPLLPETSLDVQLNDLLLRLLNANEEHKMSILHKKATNGTLTEDEKHLYLQLLAKNKNI